MTTTEDVSVMEAIRVTETLRQQIFAGTREAGSVLSARLIADECDVSRIPARQAIEALIDEGLAVAGGARVASRVVRLEQHDITELIETCLAIDPLSMKLATLRHSREQLAQVEDLITQQERLVAKGKLDALPELVFATRELVFEAANNEVLGDVNRVYRGRIRLLLAGLDGLQQIVEPQRLLLRAVASRDAELAEQLMQRMLRIAVRHPERYRVPAPAPRPRRRRRSAEAAAA